MNFLDRIPFLPKHQGKRELVFFLTMAFGIMLAGLVAAQLGWLYKDVPSSDDATPTVTVVSTPPVTELPGIGTPAAD